MTIIWTKTKRNSKEKVIEKYREKEKNNKKIER